MRLCGYSDASESVSGFGSAGLSPSASGWVALSALLAFFYGPGEASGASIFSEIMCTFFAAGSMTSG